MRATTGGRPYGNEVTSGVAREVGLHGIASGRPQGGAPTGVASGEGEDAVGDAAGHCGADADRQYAVEPQVVSGAGLEDGRGVEVVLVAVQGLALVELGPGLLGSGEDAAVGGVDEGAVVRLQGGADVGLAHVVGPEEEPVAAAGEELALQARAFERAGADVEDLAVALW